MTVCGYETKTTFWQDFSIADMFGAKAIKSTYKQSLKAWKHSTEYITELVMVLNLDNLWSTMNREQKTYFAKGLERLGLDIDYDLIGEEQ